MNLQPWIDGNIAGQEAEGYKVGQLHCKQGWCCDGNADTPFSRGYNRGWDDAKKTGLHGTMPPKKRIPCKWDDSYGPF